MSAKLYNHYNSEDLRDIARMVRKWRVDFPAPGRPSVFIGSKDYGVSGIFYDPLRGSVCVSVEDGDGHIPSEFDPVRPVETLNSREFDSLVSRLAGRMTEALARSSNLDVVASALEQASGTISFGKDGPFVTVYDSVTGEVSQGRVVRVDRAAGASLPGTVTAITGYGRTVVMPAAAVSDADFRAVARHPSVAGLAAAFRAVAEPEKKDLKNRGAAPSVA